MPSSVGSSPLERLSKEFEREGELESIESGYGLRRYRLKAKVTYLPTIIPSGVHFWAFWLLLRLWLKA